MGFTATGATRTTAALRDGQWIINGSKLFITNAGTDITACVTITARTGENEISNLIIPNGTPGYDISGPLEKMGWHASDPRELSFRDCAVPEGNLLGPRGAGSITAAQFLKRFIENGVRWAHLDIAGMVWADKPGATYDKGATGFGVRVLDRLVADNFER